MPSLTVVMATYNGERWLPDQLASIAAQTRPPDRLIVSDDGSTDGSREIVERFAATAGFPVTVLDGPRAGLAENFWRAALSAETELIAWSDQDDVWLPAKLAACERALEASGAAFASHSAVVVDERLRELGGRYPSYRSSRRRERLTGDPWHVPSGFASVFRRELLERVDWECRPVSHQTHRPMNHDHAVSLVAFADGARVELREPLARYRQHGANAAGDPSVRGASAIGVALSVGAEQFRAQAEIARAYGAYAQAAAGGREDVGAYFEALAARCERRAAAYAPRRGRRLAALASAAARGDYRSRSRGRFGALALVKDVVSLAV